MAIYVVFCILASSLSCAPLRRGRTSKAESPFDSTNYYGGEQPGPDRVLLLESPVEGLGMRLELFQAARKSLDIVCHTIHPGPSTAAFFDAVRDAAERGISVRILLDGKASNVRPRSVAIVKALARHPNIAVRRYNPLRLLKPWKWHYLMHDKFIVVDGVYLLLGGRNLGDKFFAPGSYTGKVSNDRDVLVWKRDGAAPDSAVNQAAAYFSALWECRETVSAQPRKNRVTGAQLAEALDALHAQARQFAEDHPAYVETPLADFLARTSTTRKITLIHNPLEASRKAPWIWEQLQRIALQAEHSVMLQTPYITANQSILSAFQRIAQQKRFQVLTNSAASTPNYPAFSNYYAQRRKFVATGAQIYEYQSAHSIHGKAMVIDDRLGIMGSFNMDDRSMHLDTEIMLVVDAEPFAQTLRGAIEEYQAKSLRVRETNDYSPRESAAQAAVPVYKVPLLRAVSVLSKPLRTFI